MGVSEQRQGGSITRTHQQAGPIKLEKGTVATSLISVDSVPVTSPLCPGQENPPIRETKLQI